MLHNLSSINPKCVSLSEIPRGILYRKQAFWIQKPILDILFSQTLGIKALELKVFVFFIKIIELRFIDNVLSNTLVRNVWIVVIVTCKRFIRCRKILYHFHKIS
ncbi:MAG: hypothetical protein CO119_07010 [Flavobacteriales bacterium CG_4_9_14_3_um_filter_40_17]|nr:MAG: hypothetical protein CO119_07010 [Flavobacteriales bacterium CG_4_9_14_3_um_filter_40_17]